MKVCLFVDRCQPIHFTLAFIDREETTNTEEKLDVNNDGYLQLPDNALTLRLSRKKEITRQFVAGVRRMRYPGLRIALLLIHDYAGYFNYGGRIPWACMAENPSQYLTQRSRPDSDHKLMDPSHMKAEGVDDWLKHWLRLQNKKKRPLMLKDPSEPQPDAPTQSSKRLKSQKSGKEHNHRNGNGNGKGKGKEKMLPESSEDEDNNNPNPQDDDDDMSPAQPDADTGEHPHPDDSGSGTISTDESNLPATPYSAAGSKKSWIAFLKSLSADPNYHQLIKLLRAAKVCRS